MAPKAVCLGAIFACLAIAATAAAETVSFDGPSFDKWMYPNLGPYGGALSGTYEYAPIFAHLDDAGEDRIASMLVAFNTAASIPSGLGAESYAITSVKLTLTLTDATPSTLKYDGTHDSYETYLSDTDPDALPDQDEGRPIEAFGVGLRNGFTGLAGSISGTSTPYGESSAIGDPRNAFPLGVSTGGTLFDAIDNVGQHQEATPFAVGTTTLNGDGTIPQYAEFTFNLDVSNPAILVYLQNALNDGVLGLFISALNNLDERESTDPYARFYTKEGAAPYDGDGAPRLEIVYTIVPEPTPTLSLLLGLALFSSGRALFRRRSFQ